MAGTIGNRSFQEMIKLYTGKPGQGKSLLSADVIVGLLARNERWNKKRSVEALKIGIPFIPRRVATNLEIADWLHQKYPGMILKWSSIEDLLALTEVDIVWDEVANHLDSNDWGNLSIGAKSWLRHHEKFGVDIYANTQNFLQVDIQFRRLVDELWIAKKMLGSRRPAATKPNPRFIWGFIWLTEVDPITFTDTEHKRIGLPSWLIITQKLVSVYDTKQRIEKGKYPALVHTERHCPDCNKVQVVHA